MAHGLPTESPGLIGCLAWKAKSDGRRVGLGLSLIRLLKIRLAAVLQDNADFASVVQQRVDYVFQNSFDFVDDRGAVSRVNACHKLWK